METTRFRTLSLSVAATQSATVTTVGESQHAPKTTGRFRSAHPTCMSGIAVALLPGDGLPGHHCVNYDHAYCPICAVSVLLQPSPCCRQAEPLFDICGAWHLMPPRLCPAGVKALSPW